MKQATSHQGRIPSAFEGLGRSFGNLRLPASVRSKLRRIFHWLLELRSGGRGLVCQLPEGEVVRVLPEFRYLAWNLDEYRAFRAVLKPGCVALDVGANVGAYTLLLGQWVGAAGKVVAFEPMPQVFQALKQHLALNGLAGIVEPVNAAVSDSTTTARMGGGDSLGSNRLLSGNDAQSVSGVEVQCLTLDQFCKDPRIDPAFIKIDVEGFETAVLRGAREVIRQGGDRLALFVELHPTTWKELGFSKEEFLQEIEAQGLEIVPIVPGQDIWNVEGQCVRLVQKPKGTSK